MKSRQCRDRIQWNEIGKDIEFYRCDTAACDEVVFRMKQVRNACVNER